MWHDHKISQANKTKNEDRIKFEKKRVTDI